LVHLDHVVALPVIQWHFLIGMRGFCSWNKWAKLSVDRKAEPSYRSGRFCDCRERDDRQANSETRKAAVQGGFSRVI
jgi:hypothetical protein